MVWFGRDIRSDRHDDGSSFGGLSVLPGADHINGGPNRGRADGDATIDGGSTNDTYVSTRVTRFCPLFS